MLHAEAVTKIYTRPTGFRRRLVRAASDVDVTALRGVDLHVGAGEVVGLVGPNGAGKTTLIKIISTLLTATSGRVIVDGHDVLGDPAAVRERIGLVLTEDRSLYWRLNGRENLEFFGVMQGLGWRESRHRARQMLSLVGLEHRDKLVFGYSSGMRARLSIARALLADPRLLILDEPTRALDPIATADVGRLLRATAASGVAVLLSSHRLDEVEAVCDRIVVIVGGDVRFSGAPAELAVSGTFAVAIHQLLSADGSTADRGFDP